MLVALGESSRSSRSPSRAQGVVAASSAPAGAAASRCRGCAGKAYVTNNVDGTVSVITTATGAVSAPITVGKAPTGVAITPDGKHAYVTNPATTRCR